MGGGGVNTAAFYMRQLFFPNKELSIKQRVTARAEAYHQLLQCAGVTLDSLVTQHLVHIVGNDPAYMVVVHEASKPAVSYADANSLIMGCISRIELSTPESHSTASAFVGRSRPERRPPLTEEQKKNRVCHECGKKGHIRPACPQLNKEKQDTAPLPRPKRR
jgi:hypothetical protein